MKKLIVIFFAFCTTVFAHQGPHNFKGRILNGTVDSVAVTSMKGTWRKAFALGKDGSFEGTVQQGIGTFYMIYGDKEIPLFLTNETDITLTANAGNFDETLKFEGNGEKENNFLAQMQRDKNAVITKIENSSATNLDQDVAALIAGWQERLKDRELNFMFRNTVQFKLTQIDSRSLPAEIEKQVKAKKLIGQESPGFNFDDINGKGRELKDFKGKYVYIDVWATWCGPCLKEVPNLQKIEERYKGKNIAFISISVDEEKDYDKWKNLVKSKEMGGTQLITDKAWKSDFIQAYGINSIPRFILVDPKGYVVDADAKRPGDAELVKQLDALLK